MLLYILPLTPKSLPTYKLYHRFNNNVLISDVYVTVIGNWIRCSDLIIFQLRNRNIWNKKDIYG